MEIAIRDILTGDMLLGRIENRIKCDYDSCNKRGNPNYYEGDYQDCLNYRRHQSLKRISNGAKLYFEKFRNQTNKLK